MNSPRSRERCQVNQAYWARNPQGPFATLIGVAATYCHPEAYDGAYDDLIARVRSAAPEDDEIRAVGGEQERHIGSRVEPVHLVQQLEQQRVLTWTLNCGFSPVVGRICTLIGAVGWPGAGPPAARRHRGGGRRDDHRTPG